ncbi:MAG: NAD(P)/FAD-dependent oxidoreductase [Kiloniellales bacterium]|nr:NAD(P)/FAD-dependent oxidoreductase [Kiloniellales bacterium]
MSAAKTDVVIIGAGPVGLFSVFECGMLNLSCHVIDVLDFAGGQCAALYPEKPIYDIPGYPRIDAETLVERLSEQAAPFKPHYLLGERVDDLKRQEDGCWRVTTSKGNAVSCQAVIVAAGSGAFGPNRPPIGNIEAYEGKSVFYLVRRRDDFRNKRVVIAGGGDSAVDWAVSLAEVAERVYVVHRRPKFRAAPSSVNKLNHLADQGKLDLVTPFQLHALEGEDGKLERVVAASLKGEIKKIEADVLLPFFGLSMNLGPIADWGLALEKNLVKIDPATSRTDTEGIYAVGDIVTYPGKLKLILSGFHEAAMAAHAIRNQIHPDEDLHWEYSTTKGLPGQSD